MPTAREFEDAAVDFCLNSSGVGVWAMRLQEISRTEYQVTVRLGRHHRGDLGGLAIIRVTYQPERQSFLCQPAESTLPEPWLVEDSAYLSN